jgi:phosphate transport system substrate-binding protein
VAASAPAYAPLEQVGGVIRIWGHGNVKLPWMMNLVRSWEAGFQRYQPGIRIQYEMHGTSSAVPALYAGLGDVAILGEEILPEAVQAFEKVKHYPPTTIQLLTGSLAVRNFDYAQMFFVHRDNPLTRLTLEQLDGVFGAEHRRGPRNLRRWGDVGLTGEWAGHAIVPYGWRIDDSFGIFLEGALLEGSHHWNNALHEYAHIPQADGSIYDHGQQILDNLAQDRFGIAVSNIRYAGPNVKPLVIAAGAGAPYYPATVATLIDQTYPLTRLIPAVIDRPPGQPIDPKVREFLRYILSREGQQAIVSDGRYLPLARPAVMTELGKLDSFGTVEPTRIAPDLGNEPAYRAAAPVSGVVRIWGTRQMAGVVQAWDRGFRRVQPAARLELHLFGTATAMPSIYFRTGDIGLLGRESNVTDNDGFLHVTQYRPLRLELMQGSWQSPEQSPAIAVLVPRANPLTQLTLAQLSALVGWSAFSERASAAPSTPAQRVGDNALHPPATWSMLGLGGPWATRPIHIYCCPTNSGTGLFLAHVLLGDSRKWNWPAIREFSDRELPDGTVVTADEQIVAALARDPDGIGLASLHFATDQVKPVALARHPDGPFVLPTLVAVRSRDYALSRRTYAFVNQPPGAALDPSVREFLRYALSREGQMDVAREGGYLPLSLAERNRQASVLAR